MKRKPTTKPTTAVKNATDLAPMAITKSKRTRKGGNDFVTNERRQQLIDMIKKTSSIREAARMLKINNSTAKSIFYKYKKTG